MTRKQIAKILNEVGFSASEHKLSGLYRTSQYIYTTVEEGSIHEAPISVEIHVCNSRIHAKFLAKLSPEVMKSRMLCFMKTRALDADKEASKRRAEIKRVKQHRETA